MIGVNLIPESVIVAKRRRRRLSMWATIVGVTCGLGALPTAVELARHRKVVTLTSERASAKTKIERARGDLNRLGLEIKTLEAQNARADALRTKRPWAELLSLIADSMPEEVWLLSIVTDPASPRMDARAPVRPVSVSGKRGDGVVTLEAPTKIILEGFAVKTSNMFDFIEALRGCGAFSSVDLIGSSHQNVFNSTAVEFRVAGQW